jgi:hypothetical protein
LVGIRRQRILRAGRVSVVEAAMRRLKEREVVELDEALQAVMVPNVLVVLCVEQATE